MAGEGSSSSHDSFVVHGNDETEPGLIEMTPKDKSIMETPKKDIGNEDDYKQALAMAEEEIVSPKHSQGLEIDLAARKKSDNQPYDKVNQMSPPIMDKTSSTKVFVMVSYKIIHHVLLLYAVIGVSYLLFVPDNESNDQSALTALTNTGYPSITSTPNPSYSIPTMDPTLNPSEFTVISTAMPSSNPGADPSSASTSIPTFAPTMEPTRNPSVEPTMKPTSSPTVANYHVGDYKISAQVTSHDQWLLCDGSEVSISQYPLLYGLIGSSFGSSLNSSLFMLPNGTNNVMGIVSGSNGHNMGTVSGQETITLSQEQMPSHNHHMMPEGSICQANMGLQNAASYPYLATWCDSAGYTGDESRRYYLTRTNSIPNTALTGPAGNGNSIDIMQPTIYAGNLFVFAL